MKTKKRPKNALNSYFLKPMFAILLSVLMWPSFGQNTNTENKDRLFQIPFAVIDEVPVFPGCEDAENKKDCFNKKMAEHISSHFYYPEEAIKQNLEGRVNVVFTIGKDGYIKNLKLRGPNKILENATKDIINKLPKMVRAGQQEGKDTECPYSIPVNYVLSARK